MSMFKTWRLRAGVFKRKRTLLMKAARSYKASIAAQPESKFRPMLEESMRSRVRMARFYNRARLTLLQMARKENG